MATPEVLYIVSSTLSSSYPATSTLFANAADDTSSAQDSDYSDPGKDQVLYNAVMATNSISLAACILTVSMYIFLRRKNPRLMSRTSLRLSIAMACSDAILHGADLTGYFDIPRGFVCGFLGGWMFATPSLLSTFYACTIALNTQLIFVHHCVPNDNKQILYFIVPPILSLLITTPSLLAGVYGFDETYNYCWYNTDNVSTNTLLIRIIMTWSLWLFIAGGYLVIAVMMITCFLGSKRGPLTGRSMSDYLKRHPSQAHPSSDDVNAAIAATMERREMARRALTVRVLGYMVVPFVCVFPGVVTDVITRARPDISIPAVVELVAAITAGLMGTFNTILLCFDPSIVAVVFWPFWKKRKDKKTAQKRNKSTQPSALDKPLPPLPKDPEMGGTPTSSYETQETVITPFQHDYSLELFAHFAVNETLTGATTVTSTIGYDAEELANIFYGL